MYKNYKKNYPYYEVSPIRDFKQMLEESIRDCEGRPAFRYMSSTTTIPKCSAQPLPLSATERATSP